MTFTLLRELRLSQGFLARAALMLVLFAVELASFTMVSISTRAAEQSLVDHTQGAGRENTAAVGVWTNGAGTRMNIGNDVGSPENFAKVSEDIRAADTQAISDAAFYPTIAGIVGKGRAHVDALNALPPAALAEGRAPGRGEVAITPQIASDLGIGIGDQLSLNAVREVPGADLTLTVTGFLRVRSSDAIVSRWGDAVISPDDAAALATSAGNLGDINADGAATSALLVVFSWDGPVPASAEPYMEDGFGGESTSYRPDGVGEVLAASLAALLAIATLVASALAARKQVRARSRWADTVRALGATRRNVVLATLAEASITGGVVAILGGLMGWATKAVLVAHTNSSPPATFLPSTAPYPAWAMGVTLLISLLLAKTLSVVPAYWAARTSPPKPPAG